MNRHVCSLFSPLLVMRNTSEMLFLPNCAKQPNSSMKVRDQPDKRKGKAEEREAGFCHRESLIYFQWRRVGESKRRRRLHFGIQRMWRKEEGEYKGENQGGDGNKLKEGGGGGK